MVPSITQYFRNPRADLYETASQGRWGFMANNEKRSCLRGLESAIFDLVVTGADTEQWAEWLNFPLQHAAAVGDENLVMVLKKAGANSSDSHEALKGGQAILAPRLVTRGTSVTGRYKSSGSALHRAAALGDEALLLKKRALPNGRSGASSLYFAAAEGRLEELNVLLAAGADVRPRYKEGCTQNSALDVAASNGHVEIVRALIRSGANVIAADSDGLTALHKAAFENQAGVIDILVEAGANVNAALHMSLHMMPLHCAAEAHCLEAIVALLKNGARVEELDGNGCSPLYTTAFHGDVSATEALLAAGADVNAPGGGGGDTALHTAAYGDHEDVARALLQAGADVNATTSDSGCTPLHSAAQACSKACTARVLIEAGAVVDVRDKDGRTPLHHCATNNDGSEPMAVLLECGANPKAQDLNGYSPLHLAAEEFSATDAGNAIDLLLRWGADETAVNFKHETPLELAEDNLRGNDIRCLRHLLAQAPFDRNWRRRGWLLLYRAYPRKLVPIPGIDGAPSHRAKKCRARSASTETAGGASVVRGGGAGAVASGDGGAPVDWSGVVTWVVGMELEGVFRNIVEHL